MKPTEKKFVVELSQGEMEALRLASIYWNGRDDHHQKVEGFYEVMDNLGEACDKICAVLWEVPVD